MSQKLVLDTDLLRARVMNLEYKHLTAEEIRRIYIEETGSNPPAQIHVYHSEDFRNVNANDSGFDGTIIHFYDEEKGINQMYTIARGSEMQEKDTWKPLDWAYNAFGIFVGQSKIQYNDALRFDDIMMKKITEELKRNGQTIKLEKIGLGHSQGGNHAEMIQLTKHRFDQVYVINDAPPNVYQLAYIDLDFRSKLEEEFGVNISTDYNIIYSIPPSELKSFAEEYYKKQIDERSIHHLTSQEDMLYAVSDVRGFIDIGSRQVIDTNMDFTSIKDLVSKISDKDIRTIQMYLSEYSDIYNEKGFDGVVQAMTGVDIAFIESLQGYDTMDYVWNAGDIVSKANHMLGDMKVKIPELMENVAILYKNLDPIFSVFVELGYVTPEEKKTVLTEVKGIEKDAASIQQLLHKTWNWSMVIPFLTPYVADDILQWKASIEVLFQIRDKVLNILKRLQTIQENTMNLQNAITTSVKAHTLNEVINALARSKGRTYDENGDLILIKKVGEHEIRMNLSSAVRIYQKGLQIMEEKEAVLHRMKQRYFDEYVEDFETQKRELMKKIEDMEQNPWAYQHLLGHFTYDAEQVYVLRRIDVHESIPPLDPMIPHIFETMFSYYEQEISKGKELVTTIKKSFEEFFEQDQNVSKIFDL
jgi:hypothetical protein